MTLLMVTEKVLRYINKKIRSNIAIVISCILRTHIKKKYGQIWLFGGFAGRKFDDNSAALYIYMIENKIEVKLFWVISKKYYKDFEKQIIGDVLFLNSIKCNVFALLSDVHIYSHGLLDISPYESKRLNKSIKVFLGHGVDGLKKINATADGTITINDKFELFNSVSEYEKNIKVNGWHVSADKVIITGMPRYDYLVNSMTSRENIGVKFEKILYMPTWRDWLIKSNKTNEWDDYYHGVKSLIENRKLVQYLETNNIKLFVYIHINMIDQVYFGNHISDNIEVCCSDLVLQSLIQECNYLVTDYSSVAWDFLYMNKKVIFYQFDLEKYLDERGSYINMQKDLFGPVCYTSEECVNLIENVNNIGCSSMINSFRSKYFKYHDNENCDRLYKEICKRVYM